jgi:hypothetical protein
MKENNMWEYRTPFDTEDELPEEWIWERLRAERNRRLALCDWTMISDATTDKVAWGAYRQALRELPSNTIDPRDAVFPTSPSEVN